MGIFRLITAYPLFSAIIAVVGLGGSWWLGKYVKAKIEAVEYRKEIKQEFKKKKEKKDEIDSYGI